tara:strand:- start:1238 stop:1492 length:255 start_codon:yes stop_codon:yes gene_type:complete
MPTAVGKNGWLSDHASIQGHQHQSGAQNSLTKQPRHKTGSRLKAGIASCSFNRNGVYTLPEVLPSKLTVARSALNYNKQGSKLF